jgi:hypothetical protein
MGRSYHCFRITICFENDERCADSNDVARLTRKFDDRA